jgi:enolase
MTIKEVRGEEISDSRGEPTIRVSILLDDGKDVSASVPAGTSTGSFEAKVVPTKEAVKTIADVISPRLSGVGASDQQKIDQILMELDGTERKEKLGGNTTTGVSLAAARAGSISLGVPLYQYISQLSSSTPSLPKPLMVVLCGGKHGKGNPALTFQEFSVGATFEQGKKIFTLLQSRVPSAIGLEGALSPNINNIEALDVLTKTIIEAGYSPDDIVLGLDCAASAMARKPSVSELIALSEKFPIRLFEDPLPEEAWHLWAQFKLELREAGREDIYIVGDDLFTTNKRRLEKGITKLVANSILIKPNQIGTLTETLQVIELARRTGFSHIVSHRSGETEDDFIADLAVGTGAAFLKAGAPNESRPERMAKYRRLAEISKDFQ